VSRIPDEKLCTQRDGPSNDVAIVGPRDVYGRRSRQTGDRPWERCPCGRAANDPGERTLSDSNPTSVKESAAAEEQHHEDDDEQSGRVHFFPSVFWRSRSPVMDPLRRVTNNDDLMPRGQTAAIPMCRLTAVQAVVCSLLNTVRLVSVPPYFLARPDVIAFNGSLFMDAKVSYESPRGGFRAADRTSFNRSGWAWGAAGGSKTRPTSSRSLRSVDARHHGGEHSGRFLRQDQHHHRTRESHHGQEDAHRDRQGRPQ
jgi:hypothetical protein